MRVAALGIDCSDPDTTWHTVTQIPEVDLVVLPELAFMPWLCATREVDPVAWARAAEEQHLERLADIPARVVVGTRANGRLNEAFAFTADTGLQVLHQKTYLPDEEGFWEASWYDRGPVSFQVIDTPAGRVGTSVCTEMWFTQHAFAGADIIAVPRATPIETTEKWLAGGMAHAVTSGAFCVSSNRSEAVSGTTMGGAGWIADPDGTMLAVTSAVQPVIVADLDLEVARTAKSTYPRYVER
ncbi:MAG: carbon-nitrogen hydrolase family protein [Candidatus Nanopelagicales bacterium]|jgi:predicted amidohydrolase|nr:carbon-nitrogen hydrolase family protein [Actinomycetota bacterium]MCB8998368.1 carbon-nitrogen hydrolase family protein [Actinomycetota bacterium]HNE88475.1 carbon-nitrogen hydrolase family protein [Actinomycetota bacterium]HNL51344.1 carbon-nitrogen hydrolase family protein [Actinomycetota bacterium]HNO15108.1 carbon-nitrogen hydrolase family protein [Actinomycetota bacterium]